MKKLSLSFLINKAKSQGWKGSLFWAAVIVIPGGELLLVVIPFLRKKQIKENHNLKNNLTEDKLAA